MSDLMEYVVDMLLEDDEDGATDAILTESDEVQILRSLGGEATLMNYLMKFEEYLDNHDVYLFDGWEEAEVISQPKVEKFWVTVWLRLQPKTDLRGALRVTNDKEGQNQVKYKKNEDGGYVMAFKILKRYLDQIEQDNKDKSDQLSDEELQEL